MKAKMGVYAFCSLLIFFLLTMGIASTVLADANTSIFVTVPITQSFNIAGTDRKDVQGAFSYELTANESRFPMPAGTVGGAYSFSMKDSSNASITIEYTKPDLYLYTIKQVVTEKKTGYKYDAEVYTLKVYVRNAPSQKLESEVIVQRLDKNKVSTVAFSNSYKPLPSDPRLMVDPPVKKAIRGTPSTASEFLFRLTADNVAFPMPEGSANGIKNMTIVGAGEKDFGTWEYTAAGTYSYVVSEVNNGASGYAFDTMLYTITDVVTDDNGQLKLNRTIRSKNGEIGITAYNFTNVYHGVNPIDPVNPVNPVNPPIVPAIIKVLKPIVSPKTGDETNGMFALVIFIIAIALVISTAAYLIYMVAKSKEKDKMGK